MTSIERQARLILNTRVKLKDSLGKFEDLVVQYCAVQNTLNPTVSKPTLVLASAANGIAEQGVSKSDWSVTEQMTNLFKKGNGSCAVMCKEEGVTLKVVDLGVRKGTEDFSKKRAMSLKKVQSLLNDGMSLCSDLSKKHCNTVLLGDMGVGNTTTASALMYAITKQPMKKCLVNCNDSAMVEKRKKVIENAVNRIPETPDIFTICSYVGGYEIVYLAGVVLGAYNNNMVVINDGFITTVAVLVAYTINKKCLSNVIFAHTDTFLCHATLLKALKVKPVLNIGFRLGEGTGAVACLPLVKQAVNLFNNLYSFSEARVSCSKDQKRIPFAFGTTSYILPDNIVPNVNYLKDKTEDIELVLFESKEFSNFPSEKTIKYLKNTAEKNNFSYTVHLPYDVKAGSASETERKHAVFTWIKTIELTKDLPVHGFVIHLEPDDYSDLQPSPDIGRWQKQIEKSLFELKNKTAGLINPSLICVETLNYNLIPYLPLIKKLGFSVCLDVGHLFKCKLYNERNVRRLLNSTRIIHLHGVNKYGKDHVSLADHANKKELNGFLAILRDYERKCIVVTVEVFNEKDFTRSFDYLRSKEVFA